MLDAVEADMSRDPVNIAPGSSNALLLRAELDAARAALSAGRGPFRRLGGAAQGGGGWFRNWRRRGRQTESEGDAQ